MKPLNDHHLLELFWGLRKAGLSLRIEDYQLLCQAWEKGFCPNNIQELGELCQRLWVKSLKEKKLFDEYFNKYSDRYLEHLKQLLFQLETNSSFSDESSGEGRQLTKGSSRDAQSGTPQARLQQKIEATTPPSTPTPSPLPETVITEAARVGQAVPIPRSTYFTLTKEYFPVHRRQMQQSWRKLRLSLREGVGTELDIPATIKRISQKGLFLDPVLIPKRTNQTELLLLLDQSNSMMPFAPLAEQLVQTAQKDGRLGETKTYYFRNSPKDFLFRDLDLLQKQSLTNIIPHLHKNRTVVLIFSDGGAARGGYNQERVKLTEKFLNQLKPAVRKVVWLNPVPKYRWFGTTASQLSDKVFMYPFSEQGWRVMIDVLRGKQKSSPEDFDYLLNWSELVANQESVEQLYKRLVSLQPPDTKNDPDKLYRYENASRYIADFARRGQAYLDLACHAAFPLAITPDLVYYLRENFSFFDQKGKKLNIPWIAVPDLLLSNLCYPIGYQLYEMDSAVRHLLLKLLQQEERFGNKRLDELSDCLLYYLQQGLNNPNLKNQDFGENPEWIALAYTKPSEVARQLALMLHQTYSGDKAEKIKSVSLTATFAEPLAEANFQPLLTFARGWGRLARGYQEEAKEVFEQLPKKSPELNIEGVKLWIPGRKLPQFSFDVVTVNATGEIIKRETHQAKYFKEDLGNRVTLDMVYIPGGSFLMGSPETEEGRYENEESPQHKVTVQPFFMGKYPVTQKQWRVVAAFPQVNRELHPNPSNFKGVNRPVESISWYDAVEFCDRLSTYTGKNYRLPSEAEWEYACRAGTTTPFHFGETITPELANYDGNYTYASGSKGEFREKTTTVGSFKVANAFGLFDMHGNIWEWCADRWHKNYENASSDGSAWLTQSSKDNDNHRMLRGGSWLINPRHCRSAYRNDVHPDSRDDSAGFRVVLSGARSL
ncbi:hypothetical protein WA1_38635 [Scytonema hofmannii PCC 7110]|uniref:Sulfatase-modifying factor enzyme-like domain-containing protein n=1 Tax=Scytonema hofmannii PCC 7110 TaxID=128403 RepID=A0A139X0L9_9CYAN|nr:SUMF1/EgtB/PvdO family nonheme iron enzyme [Scytonema hofmannii]KYC38259.1 hypothetical protein WA1_38635 [Scytonema hofmannii PCC 7110]